MKQNFSKITIKLSSSSKILNWSYGEVKNSNFINYKNLKPEKDGLFCLNIFSCYKMCCEKNKCICFNKDKYINLKKSHFEYRMGHIHLFYPVLHIWFLKTLPNNVSNILNISYKTIEKIINFKLMIVIRSFIRKMKKNSILIYKKYKKKNFFSLSGVKALKKLLSDNELLLDCKLIKKKINNTESYIKLFSFLERINKIYIFFLSGNKPSWLCIKILPVVPPKMRPLIPLSKTKFASSDLNELYKKIIDRNLRLYQLMYSGSPRQILINERILLQEAVSALFDNEKIENPILTKSKRILKSFSNSIKGKYGRFRQNLLGKRVDFSGRTVISVGPDLLIFQCELPIFICIELFKPFIYCELKKQNELKTISFIEDYYKNNKKKVIILLEKIVKKYTILLNRAPTLHRMGIQSFRIILTQDKTIKLHPLVCLSYNADFDGDQMAVHLPLTIYSQLESKFLLLSINNIISPSNGDPIIIPTQDIIMGIYFLTYNFNKNDKIFNIKDIIYYLNKNNIDYNKNIIISYNLKKIKTTIGRYILYLNLLKLVNLQFLNKLFRKKEISYLIKYIYEFFGLCKIIKVLDKLKRLGFFFVTIYGLTISYNDLVDIKSNFLILKIIRKLKYKKNIFDIINMMDKLYLNLILKYINYKKINFKKKLNNIFIMLDSGSRGSMLQIKQLIAYRGFFSKSNGDIISDPILENLKIGLTMKNYFISSFGSRKGLTDTSLKTANSGYLTRKLIDVMQDIVIYKVNCFTKVGSDVFIYKYKNILSLYKKIFGRVLLNDVFLENLLFIKNNTLIDNKIIFLIIKKKIQFIVIRTVSHCISTRGVCVSCYGIDLSNFKLVNLGVPIGIISAQSIGEPGTQLTMRTFHTGGVANFFYNSEFLILNNFGFLSIKKSKFVLNIKNELIVLSINCNIYIKFNKKIKELYKLSYGCKIFFRNGFFLKKGTKISDYEKNKFCIFSENYGFLKKNFSLNKEYCYEDNKYYYKTNKSIILIVIGKNEKKYFIPKGFFIVIEKNNFILPGTIIAKIINLQKIKSSIIGGLPRLSELFEARIPKKKTIISEIDGVVKITFHSNLYYKLMIISKYGFFKEYILNYLRKIFVNSGDYVKVGDLLSDGKPDLNDIINLISIDYLIDFFIEEVNNIYIPQGIYINEKHLELVLKQMTKKARVLYSGDCFFIRNDILYLEDILTENISTLKFSRKISFYERVVIGITKASLESSSFFSAASFQETTKILTDSAIRNRIDYLLGLKENVVVGKLIPAGTGLVNFIYYYDKKCKNRNDVVKRKNLKLYLYSY